MDLILEDQKYWTGPMILLFLERNLSGKELKKIPIAVVNKWKNESYLIEESKLLEYLKLILAPVDVTNISVFINLVSVRLRSYTSQYFKLKGACLDYLRPPARFASVSKTIYSPKQECLHLVGDLTTAYLLPKAHNSYELARMAAHVRMDKLARNLKLFESVQVEVPDFDETFRRLAIQNVSEFMDEEKTILIESLQDESEKKEWITQFVFEGVEDHYLIPYFQKEYDRTVDEIPPEERIGNEFINLVQTLYFVQNGAKTLLELKMPYLLRDSMHLPARQIKKPCVRSFELNKNENGSFVFIKELENAVNVVHKMKGNSKEKFVSGSLPIDENDEICNMVEVTEVEKILQNQGLQLSDIEIVVCDRYVTMNMILHSPTYLISIPAEEAFHNIFEKLMKETVAFSLLPQQQFKKLKNDIKKFNKIFVPQKENVYTIGYNTFSNLMDNIAQHLESHLENADPFEELGNNSVNMKFIEKLYKDFKYFDKFKHFGYYFRLVVGSTEKLYLHDAGKMRKDLVFLSFFTEFPELTQFIHNQKACHEQPVCMMEFVHGDGTMDRCNEKNVELYIQNIRQRASIPTDQILPEGSLVPKNGERRTNITEKTDMPSSSSPSTENVSSNQSSEQGQNKPKRKNRNRRRRPKTQLMVEEEYSPMVTREELIYTFVNNITEKTNSDPLEGNGEIDGLYMSIQTLECENFEQREETRKLREEVEMLKLTRANPEKPGTDLSSLQHELSLYDERVNNLQKILSKIAEFGNNIRWKDELLSKNKEKLDMFIAKCDSPKSVQMAKNAFEMKRLEYETYAGVAIQNIQLLSETPELETLQKLQPMPEMPKPLENEQAEASCTIC